MPLGIYDETRPAWFSAKVIPANSLDGVELEGFVSERRRIDSLVVASTCSYEVELTVHLRNTQYLLLGTYTVPVMAGYTGATPIYDLLAAMRAVGIAEIVLAPDDTLEFRVADELTTPETVSISGLGGLLT